MKLRIRLILAFLLLSVVPLGAVTVYSYISNRKALQAAATREADQLATELSQRMQLVTAQLSARVEHLMDISTPAPAVERTAQVKSAEEVKAEAVLDANLLNGQAADALGEAAMLLNTVEVRGMRGPGGGGRGRGGTPRSGQPGVGQGGGSRGGFPRNGGGSDAPSPASPPSTPMQSTRPPALMAPPPPSRPGPFPGNAPRTFSDRQRGSTAGPPPAASSAAPSSTPSADRTTPAGGGQPGEGSGVPGDESDRISIDVGPIARDVFRQLVPEGTNPNDMTPEQRQRVSAEINQHMLGINEGIKLAAAELQRKADEAKRKADADVNAAKTGAEAAAADQAKAAAAPMKRRSALSGNRIDVTMEQNGKVVRAANAEINLPNLLMTVFSSMPRGQGEVPFAVAKDNRIYTPTAANRATVEQLGPASRPDGASMVGEWIVVMTKDPTGSGLRLGIARPVGDSLSELRRTAGRNAGLGLLCIGLAIIGVVPLSGRLTRNLSTLTTGVQRIAQGDYATRVSVKSHDEIGQLAQAFNLMAADVEQHQRAVVGQERIKRELELGRQIQHDMLPREPLRLGLTEIEGVSVPAREVGGDFFNYFALDTGHIALLVGDVSGKGVGAALLMANIQASLRTRFALGQDLSAIADAIDRDIEANSPGQMYATLFVGILDPATRELRYVNAGHHPQYALRAHGGIERMGATGLPVGLLSGRGYLERRVQLAAGDLIFFYTDGCIETENEADDMFGVERLEPLLLSCRVDGPDSVLQHVERALKEFRGTREPFDDATMMAVRVG